MFWIPALLQGASQKPCWLRWIFLRIWCRLVDERFSENLSVEEVLGVCGGSISSFSVSGSR
jgi:hypothetical protein